MTVLEKINSLKKKIRELTVNEVEDVSGGWIVNAAGAIVGATTGMALYSAGSVASMSTGGSGPSGCGFLQAAVTGGVAGAGLGHPGAVGAGAVAGGVAYGWCAA